MTDFDNLWRVRRSLDVAIRRVHPLRDDPIEIDDKPTRLRLEAVEANMRALAERLKVADSNTDTTQLLKELEHEARAVQAILNELDQRADTPCLDLDKEE